MLNELFPVFEPEEKKLKRIATAKGMKKLFSALKEQGLFPGYSSYQAWCDKKYKAKEILKDKLEVRK